MDNKRKELNLNAYAHIGDAVYELFVREKTVYLYKKISEIHKQTTKLVCASFQAEVFSYLTPFLTEEESELSKRARNLKLTQCKRNNQSAHHLATALEVLIGFLYVNDKSRLRFIFEKTEEYIKQKAEK